MSAHGSLGTFTHATQNCHLDRRTLSICISMIERGVNPEALAVRLPISLSLSLSSTCGAPDDFDGWEANRDANRQQVIKELRQEAQEVEQHIASNA